MKQIKYIVLSVVFIAILPLPALADSVSSFKILAHRDVVKDEVCQKYGGKVLLLTDKGMQGIVNLPGASDGVIKYGSEIYVIYATEDVAKRKFSYRLCRFKR